MLCTCFPPACHVLLSCSRALRSLTHLAVYSLQRAEMWPCTLPPLSNAVTGPPHSAAALPHPTSPLPRGLQIKYYADPSMHAIPAACMNPTNTMWLGQSMDNQVCITHTLA